MCVLFIMLLLSVFQKLMPTSCACINYPFKITGFGNENIVKELTVCRNTTYIDAAEA